MGVARAAVVAFLVLAAVVLQTSFFASFAVDSVVPNVVLLLVVAAGMARGPSYAAVVGFVGGLCLDLVPPADSLAGRWALALLLAGWLTGQVRNSAHRSTLAALAIVALGSFVAMSTYTLLGMLTGTTQVGFTEAVRVLGLSVGFDLLLAPFVLPPTLRLLRRLAEPHALLAPAAS